MLAAKKTRKQTKQKRIVVSVNESESEAKDEE